MARSHGEDAPGTDVVDMTGEDAEAARVAVLAVEEGHADALLDPLPARGASAGGAT